MPPAASVDDLFVGENRLAFVAPPLRSRRAIRKSTLQEEQEEPLRPAVVLRRRRIDLALPIVGTSGNCELTFEVGCVARNGFSRMRSFENRFVLGRQSERVPSHRMQNVESRHPLVASDHVTRNVIVQMPNAKPGARRIRKHLKDVKFRPPRLLASKVQIGPLPLSLPSRLNFLRVVTLVHGDETSLA